MHFGKHHRLPYDGAARWVYSWPTSISSLTSWLKLSANNKPTDDRQSLCKAQSFDKILADLSPAATYLIFGSLSREMNGILRGNFEIPHQSLSGSDAASEWAWILLARVLFLPSAGGQTVSRNSVSHAGLERTPNKTASGSHLQGFGSYWRRLLLFCDSPKRHRLQSETILRGKLEVGSFSGWHFWSPLSKSQVRRSIFAEGRFKLLCKCREPRLHNVDSIRLCRDGATFDQINCALWCCYALQSFIPYLLTL